MKLSAFVVPVALVFAVLLLAPAAEAQRPFGDSHDRQIPCLCAGEEGTGTPFCSDDERTCSNLTACISSADCAAGELCLDADNGCMEPVCIVVCDAQTCTDPGNITDGFEPCPDVAPTMGQWGLIALAALLLLGGALMLRLNGRAARAAIVLIALSVLAGAWAYASIQASPTCGASAETSVLADLGR